MDNQEVISTLNDLIQTCKDGEQGFRACAEGLNDAQLKLTFAQRAERCAQAAAELQEMVRAMGGVAEISSSMSGALHRRWVDIKAAITGKDPISVLSECERGEDVAMKSYRAALSRELPQAVRAVVERQFAGVQKNHDAVKHMRDSAQAAATLVGQAPAKPRPSQRP